MTTITAMTDAQLDGAYEAAYRVRDNASLAATSGEIIKRLSSVSGFLRAMVSGTPRFPLYTSHTGLNEGGAARSSTSTSAGNVASSIGSAVSGAGGVVGSTIFKATAPLMVMGLIAVVGLYVWKMPKKTTTTHRRRG